MDADQVGATGQEFDPSVTDRARNLGHAALTYLQEIKASIATGVATSGGLMGVTRMVGEGFLSADIPPTMAAGFGVAAAALYQKTRAPKQYPEKHEEYLAIDIEQGCASSSKSRTRPGRRGAERYRYIASRI